MPALLPERPTLPKVRDVAAGCKACDLYQRGTQTVFGDGPARAGIMLVGDKGYILDNRVYPESLRKDLDQIERLPPSPGGHFLEWINACKGKQPAAGSNFDWAGPLAEAVL